MAREVPRAGAGPLAREGGCARGVGFDGVFLPTFSTPMIDRIISGARRAGAVGAKVCGAGGGGCVALVIEPEARARVEALIESVGATLLPMRVARQGVSVKVS